MKRIATIIGLLLLTITLLVLADIRYYDSTAIEIISVDKKIYVDSLAQKYDSLADPYRAAYLSLIDSVRYPGVEVDKITIQRMYNPIAMVFPKILGKSDIASFDKFINDSSNFEFCETTFDKVDYVVKMYNKSRIVSKMWIGLDCRIIDCKPMNPRMKFGMMNDTGLKRLIDIIK